MILGFRHAGCQLMMIYLPHTCVFKNHPIPLYPPSPEGKGEFYLRGAGAPLRRLLPFVEEMNNYWISRE
jgi:hypothetical protein